MFVKCYNHAMDFVKKHRFNIILISAIAIRLILVFLDFSFDVHNHIAWGKDLTNRGFPGFYETRSSEVYASAYPNYPPFITFIFYLLYLVYIGIVKAEWWLNTHFAAYPSKLVFFIESRTFAAGIFKIPALLSDFGIAWISYLFSQKIAPKHKNLKAFVFAFVLLNPAYFYNSSFWGQIDSIPLFFALAAFYLLWYTKRPVMSAVMFTLSLLVKPTTLVFLPLYAIIFFLRYPKKAILKSFVISFIVFWVSFLPFYKTGNIWTFPFIVYSEKILAAQSLVYVTNGAFNFWLMITQWKGIKATEPFIGGISYEIYGYIVTGILFLVALSIYFKRKNNIEAFFYAAFIMSFASFIFLTKMHERYSMLMLPFLFLLVLKNPKMMKWYVVISFICFLNLFHSWPAIKIEVLKAMIDYIPTTLFLSAVNTLLFFYVFILFAFSKKLSAKEKK